MVQRLLTTKLSSCNAPKITEDTKNGVQPFETHAICICNILTFNYFTSSKINTIVKQIDKRLMVQIWSLKFITSILDVISNISGDATAAFVFNTFNEWFANTTIATIKKTLRTTNGRHKIEIDEKVLAKYLQN